jgi:hypothetical protein
MAREAASPAIMTISVALKSIGFPSKCACRACMKKCSGARPCSRLEGGTRYWKQTEAAGKQLFAGAKTPHITLAKGEQ